MLETTIESATELPDGAETEERPANKRRVLFLCHTLPYPLDGGVWLRTYNVMKLLGAAFDLRMLCFERTTPRQSPAEIREAIQQLSPFGSIEVFDIPRHHARTRALRDHLGSLLSRRAFTIQHYRSRLFREAVERELAQNDFDLVHLDSLDLSGYLPLPSDLPVVCVHHNVESRLLRRRADAEWGPKAWYIRRQAQWTEDEERTWCDRVALNVMVSDHDAADMARLCPTAEFTVVPNGVDTDAFPYAHTGQENGIVFVGGLSWYPNRDAFEHFATEIAPLVRARHPDVPITWVGGGGTKREQQVAEGLGIHLTGWVADIRPIVQAARCYVVPLRVGGGTRLKVLDAWSMGKAMVSTSIGCEGLAAESGTNALVADEPEAFADAVCRVLEDDDLAERLGRAARRTVEGRYSWDRIGPDMVRTYEQVIASRSRRGR